jgi:sugar (pentulose or hexulose) kinase
VRQERCGLDLFRPHAFERTPPGNEGRLALPWFVPEITPPVLTSGVRACFDFAQAAPEVRVRAVVEAQALALRAHADGSGVSTRCG